MDIRDINLFLKSDAGNEFRDSQFSLEFPISDFQNTFSLSTLYRYVSSQVENWDSHDSLPPELLESRNYFANIKERIEKLVENIISGHSSAVQIEDLRATINKRYERIIPGDSTEALFLISLFKDSAKLFSSAYRFFMGNINYGSFSDKFYFQGVLMAAMHEIRKNRAMNTSEHEKKSLNLLKKRVEKYVSDSDEEIKSLLLEGKININEYVDELENMKKTNSEKFKKWFALNQSTAQNLVKEVDEERKNIERTYKELLQLQAPAQHWKDTAEKLLKEGRRFMLVLFIIIAICAIALYFLLWKTPEGMLASFFNDDKTSALRWSIVFITFLSLMFIGIQSLRKAMFSSFHLARDAQEREKLTMYYLSLIKEGAVSEDDKTLILQSLFSRSDSGLLKEDSSPSMPGLIDKFKPS